MIPAPSSNVRILPFYVRYAPQTYRNISKVRQATPDPFETFCGFRLWGCLSRTPDRRDAGDLSQDLSRIHSVANIFWSGKLRAVRQLFCLLLRQPFAGEVLGLRQCYN